MATIALNGTSINFGMGICAFDSLGTAFSSAKKTTGGLQKAIGNLITKIDIAKTAAKVETAQTEAKNAKTREETKESSLTLAYDKLDTLINDVGTVDNKVSTKVSAEKNDFYKKYEYLKPECEKSLKEKIKDGWNSFCDKVAEVVGGFVEWCKKHWKEILVGLAFIVVGALITVFTAGAGTAFWAAFGAALWGGLKFALISALISGGINIAVYTGSMLLSGKKLNFSDAMSSFGDGFASGFMWGGITAGVAMTVSAGFRIAASKGVTAGPKNLKNGIRTYPDTLGGDGCGGGTIRNFAASKKAPGFRFDVDIRVLGNSKLVNKLFRPPNYFHMHLPFVGTNSIPALGIVNGHIPVGLYSSGLTGAGSSNSDMYSDFKKWQRESWRKLFGN